MAFNQTLSLTGGTILGGGLPIPVGPGQYAYPPHLVPGQVPIRYERTDRGVVSSAYVYPYAQPMQADYGLCAPSATNKMCALPAIPGATAYNNACNNNFPTSYYQPSANQTSSAAPAFSSSQPLPYSSVYPSSSTLTPRPPAASSPNNFNFHLPGYRGFVPDVSFRFGKSYGRITRDVLAEFPRGHRNTNNNGNQTARF